MTQEELSPEDRLLARKALRQLVEEGILIHTNPEDGDIEDLSVVAWFEVVDESLLRLRQYLEG